MAAPLRLEYPGALYHVTSRGDGHEDVFLLDEPDREAFLELLGEVCDRFAWTAPWPEVRHQLVLGDEAFTALFAAGERKDALREVPKAQRQPVTPSLAEIQASSPDRDQAMARAHHSGVYTMKLIAEHFGVHYMTVSRSVRRVERVRAASGDGRMLDCKT